LVSFELHELVVKPTAWVVSRVWPLGLYPLPPETPSSGSHRPCAQQGVGSHPRRDPFARNRPRTRARRQGRLEYLSCRVRWQLLLHLGAMSWQNIGTSTACRGKIDLWSIWPTSPA